MVGTVGNTHKNMQTKEGQRNLVIRLYLCRRNMHHTPCGRRGAPGAQGDWLVNPVKITDYPALCAKTDDR